MKLTGSIFLFFVLIAIFIGLVVMLVVAIQVVDEGVAKEALMQMENPGDHNEYALRYSDLVKSSIPVWALSFLIWLMAIAFIAWLTLKLGKISFSR